MLLLWPLTLRIPYVNSSVLWKQLWEDSVGECLRCEKESTSAHSGAGSFVFRTLKFIVHIKSQPITYLFIKNVYMLDLCVILIRYQLLLYINLYSLLFNYFFIYFLLS